MSEEKIKSEDDLKDGQEPLPADDSCIRGHCPRSNRGTPA